MRYPEFLHNGATIGLIAPSFGIFGYPYKERFENAEKKFRNLGYKIKHCGHLYGLNEKARTASARIRAQEFMEMYLDDEVDVIYSVAGGELMMEILPYIDFDILRRCKPKYVIGYSDNTNLTFTLPVLTDTAAVYAYHLTDFGMSHWHRSIQESYEIITGKRNSQYNFDKFVSVDDRHDPGKALNGFNLDSDVDIRSLSNRDEYIEGRLIGGCLDVLSMLCGTPYGNVESFLRRYQDEGFIWFFEACDLNVLSQLRALWQLKEAGWFKYCKGILYGRPGNSEPQFEETVEDALRDVFDTTPVIYNMDFGHVAPSWTIISGAYATVEKIKNQVKITYQFK